MSRQPSKRPAVRGVARLSAGALTLGVAGTALAGPVAAGPVRRPVSRSPSAPWRCRSSG